MNQTRVSRLLGVDYPILQGGMLWLADARLAAAVSNAGGFGIISPFAGMTKDGDPFENLKQEIFNTRTLTEKPFGVNVPLDLSDSGILIDLCIREHVDVVITAAGSPEQYTDVLRASCISVLHIVSSVKQALLAESCGVDAVIAEGSEAAGRLGFDELPLFSLIPQIVRAVKIPVIAAGGIVEGSGMAASFALGAEGVQLGTRFVATEECIAHPKYKEAILLAGDTDTIITSRTFLPRRSLKTAFTGHLMELDRSGATAEKIRAFLGYRRARAAQLDGDLDEGEAYAGSSVGLINDIIPAAKVIERLIDEYENCVKNQ